MDIRINGSGRTAAPGAGAGARRADGAGAVFAPVTAEPATRAPTASTAGGTAALDGIDSLIALQAIDADRPNRRRKAMRRGHDLLDVLDELKLGLLSGEFSGSALDRIATLLADVEPSGDEELDGLMADIALRAEVELAKRGRYLPVA